MSIVGRTHRRAAEGGRPMIVSAISCRVPAAGLSRRMGVQSSFFLSRERRSSAARRRVAPQPCGRSLRRRGPRSRSVRRANSPPESSASSPTPTTSGPTCWPRSVAAWRTFRGTTRALLVALADQPAIVAELVDALIARFHGRRAGHRRTGPCRPPRTSALALCEYRDEILTSYDASWPPRPACSACKRRA